MTPYEIRAAIWKLDTQLIVKLSDVDYYRQRDALIKQLSDMGLDYNGTVHEDSPRCGELDELIATLEKTRMGDVILPGWDANQIAKLLRAGQELYAACASDDMDDESTQRMDKAMLDWEAALKGIQND